MFPSLLTMGGDTDGVPYLNLPSKTFKSRKPEEGRKKKNLGQHNELKTLVEAQAVQAAKMKRPQI